MDQILSKGCIFPPQYLKICLLSFYKQYCPPWEISNMDVLGMNHKSLLISTPIPPTTLTTYLSFNVQTSGFSLCHFLRKWGRYTAKMPGRARPVNESDKQAIFQSAWPVYRAKPWACSSYCCCVALRNSSIVRCFSLGLAPNSDFLRWKTLILRCGQWILNF